MSISPSDNLTHIFKQATPSDKMAMLLSTWFGAGLIRFAPGTWGTLAGLPVFFFLKDLGVVVRCLFLGILTYIAVWAANRCRILVNREDPPMVVIDEVAGITIATLLLPFSTANIILSFFIFRLFDIIKPFPVKQMERLPGGIGIVADDLMAGIYAYLSVRFLTAVSPWNIT